MFYDRFIKLCNEKGIKPTPLVVGMGLSSSNVSQWKKGSTPRPEVLQRLAEYFGVSVSYLMFGDNGQKEKPAPKTGNGLSERAIRIAKWFDSRPKETQKAILTLGGAPKELVEFLDHEKDEET